jgi:hypothetical protein
VKRAEILSAFRDMVDDTGTPQLWKDSEIRRYLDEAHREAAVRALLLRDSTTTALTEIAIVAGTARYVLDRRIIKVESARLPSQSHPLFLSSSPEMDREMPHWRGLTAAPRRLVIDHEGAGLVATLCGVPVEDETMSLVVFRTPLESMNTDDDEPEIPAQYHLGLLEWMAHLAYKKRDTETYDEARSLTHGAEFTRIFGEREDANVRRKRTERRSDRVAFREF